MANQLVQYLNSKSSACLDGIVHALEHVIEVEQLYDPNNTEMVLANAELESALNVRSCHRTDLRKIVAGRLLVPQTVVYSIPDPPPEPYKQYNYLPSPYRTLVKGIHSETRVVCRSKLAAFLRRLPNIDTSKNVYTFKEVADLISKYVLDKKTSIIDDRNIRVINLVDDPLGEVLGVLACHISQVPTLLREQLIPYYD